MLKEGTFVVMPMFNIHREPHNWGSEDPEAFNPDRWHKDLDENGRFICFSGGPRTCLGMVRKGG